MLGTLKKGVSEKLHGWSKGVGLWQNQRQGGKDIGREMGGKRDGKLSHKPR